MQNIISNKTELCWAAWVSFKKSRESDHGSSGEAVPCLSVQQMHCFQLEQDPPSIVYSQGNNPGNTPRKSSRTSGLCLLLLRAEVSMSPAPRDGDSTVASWQLCLLTLANRKNFTALSCSSEFCLDHFGEMGRLSGHPGGIEKPVTGAGTLRAAQAAQGRYKSSSETASAGHTMKSWQEPSPLKTTDGKQVMW